MRRRIGQQLPLGLPATPTELAVTRARLNRARAVLAERAEARERAVDNASARKAGTADSPPEDQSLPPVQAGTESKGTQE